MKTIIVYLMLFLAVSATAQVTTLTNTLTGTVTDYGLVPQARVTATMRVISPNSQTINQFLIRNDPKPATTDTNGNFAFTNIQPAFYSLTLSGQGTTWYFNVWTNTLGSTPIAALITNAPPVFPSPTTNYYTISQINALLANSGVIPFYGNGSPQSNVTANIGATYWDTNGLSLWVHNGTGNTNWYWLIQGH